jgi:RHS repeat-associated protein
MKTFLRYYVLLLLSGAGITAGAQTSSQNYIVTTVPFQAVSNPLSLNDSTTSANANTTIQYFDGLGRLSQTVQKDITPGSTDLVSGIEYDAFGRESNKWLPGATSVGNNGAYVSSYSSLASSTNGGDANPYSLTVYEASPLNRVIGEYGPGSAWSNNGKTTAYLTNGGDVKLFVASSTTLTCSGTYAPGTLYGVQTTDEDGHTVVEYTDLQGRKVLTRVAGNTDTYYVYDDLSNLRYVLPPLACDAMSNNNTGFSETTGSTLDLYGYIYHYDGRNRCVQKKLPGCDWINMVYDLSDRMILSQDGNQRLKNQWTVNKYDLFGRLLYSGVITSSNSLSLMQSTYSGSVITESYTGSGPECGYTSANLTPAKLLTVNFYDTYAHLKLLDAATNGQLAPVNLSGYTLPDTLHVKTLLTGTRIYHLNDPTKYETTAIYYDKYGHTVQTRATNHLGGYDITCSLVDFTGKPTNTYITHSINGTTVSLTEAYAYTYDKAQRLTVTKYGVNVTTPTLILSANTYDPLGRVLTKTIGGTLDATTYAYNVRSWLTGISGSRFTESLYYNTNTANLSSFAACYNGNIAAMQWSIPAESLGYNRAYTFGYDDLNRLATCNYTGGTTGAYNVWMAYDKMGNITTLNRANINTLSLTYTGNQMTKVTDALSVTQPYGSEAFQDLAKGTTTQYSYDKNGSMSYDGNSGISTIRYNVLNLPDTIQFTAGHQNYYTYDASGKKLEVQNITSRNILNLPQDTITRLVSSTKLTTDYCGDAIYQNDTLKEVLTPEGYWQNGLYYYYLKDHQGSTREVLRQDNTVMEYSDYYPDGMRFESSTSNSGALPYRYNGKELEAMNGLNEYDYGARRRETGIPVWTTVDPLAEKHPEISPYVYCGDNPMNRIDPDGRGVNDNNLLNEVTVTAPAPQNNGDDDNSFATWYQGLRRQANSNPQNTNKPSQPVFNSISPRPITLNLPNVDPKTNILKEISLAINAVGLSNDGIKIFTTNNAGKEIIYVTMKGTEAAVQSAKVLSVLKGIGTSTIVLGVLVDGYMSATGAQSWTKTGLNTGVAIVAGVIGGGPGLLIGATYYIVDNTIGWDKIFNAGANPEWESWREIHGNGGR